MAAMDWEMRFTSSGNLTDSTNNVNPVVILSSDGNTNTRDRGSSINSGFQTRSDDPGGL